MRSILSRFRRPYIAGLPEQLMLMNSTGDGSTLTLDFTTGVLDPRLTFTRASGGTYTGNDGLVYGMDFATSSSLAIGTGSKSVTLTATAGVDRRYLVGQTVYISNGVNNMSGQVTAYNASTQVLTINATATSGSGSFTSWTVGNASPRFDYDPTTLAPRGLLIEGTATNLAPYSNLQLAWAGGTNTTLTPNTTEVLSPDGTNNAAKIALTNTGYCSRFESITGLANATTYTFSYWIRGTAGNQQRVYSVTQGADLVTQSTLTYTSTGWTRVQITFTSGAVNNNVYIYVASRPSGTVNDVLYVYGCQLEAGNGASSLIPTGASTVQRLADECQLLDLTTMGFNASAGTIFVDMGARISTGSNRSYTFLPASGGNNQIFEGSGVAFQVFSGGSFVAQIGTSTSAAQKIASAYAVNDYAVSVNGGAVATDTSGALPTSLTKLTLGGSIINTAAYQFGCIRTFKYWPTRLPNAQLQSLTT